MESGFSFSYLFLSRHGIYYFRCRIPLDIRRKYNIRQSEIRKSLHTSNRREAIRKAMRMWVEYSDNNFYPNSGSLMPGIPKDKIDLIISMPDALAGLRENIGIHGMEVLSSWFISYISKIGNDPDVIRTLIENLSEEEIDAIKDSKAFKRIAVIQELQKQQQTVHTDSAYQTINQTTEKHSPPPLESKSLNILIQDFLDHYTTEYRRNKKIEPPTSSFREINRALSTFSAILKNKSSTNISKKDIKYYVDMSFELPRRLNKIQSFTHMTNEEILTKYSSNLKKLSVKNHDKKSNASIKKEFSTVKKFLKWIKREDYSISDLSDFIPPVSVSTTQKPKGLFTDNDFKLYFNSKFYIEGLHRKPSDYWIPLIAIFTGCRVEEIASLNKSDFIAEKRLDIWTVHIREDLQTNKRTKSQASQRSIPIHPQLLKLGLLEYLKTLSNNTLLFPELKPNRGGRYGVVWGNNFNRNEYELHQNTKQRVLKKDGTPRMRMGLMTRCGIEKIYQNEDGVELSKSFHSFRHHFINEIDKLKIESRLKNFIVGHKYSGSLVDNYIHSTDEDKLAMQELINQIQYPTVDFTLIKKAPFNLRS